MSAGRSKPSAGSHGTAPGFVAFRIIGSRTARARLIAELRHRRESGVDPLVPRQGDFDVHSLGPDADLIEMDATVKLDLIATLVRRHRGLRVEALVTVVNGTARHWAAFEDGKILEPWATLALDTGRAALLITGAPDAVRAFATRTEAPPAGDETLRVFAGCEAQRHAVGDALVVYLQVAAVRELPAFLADISGRFPDVEIYAQIQPDDTNLAIAAAHLRNGDITEGWRHLDIASAAAEIDVLMAQAEGRPKQRDGGRS